MADNYQEITTTITAGQHKTIMDAVNGLNARGTRAIGQSYNPGTNQLKVCVGGPSITTFVTAVQEEFTRRGLIFSSTGKTRLTAGVRTPDDIRNIGRG